MITFTVPGAPVVWKRARRNGRRYFTDPKQAEYQERVRAAYRDNAFGIWGPETALRVRLVFYLQIPPSWSRAKWESACSGELLPIGRRSGDVDNYTKAVADALNGVAYTDDAQIAVFTAIKYYDQAPRTLVQMENLK